MTRRGPIVLGSDADFRAAGQVFAEHHCLRLEGTAPDNVTMFRERHQPL
jgi:hypothetical protein